MTALTSYAQLRDQLCPNRRADTFLVSTRGTAPIYDNVRAVFRRLAADLPAGRDGDPHQRPPRVRINGLRRSFAATTLLDWHGEAADVDARLPLLAAQDRDPMPQDQQFHVLGGVAPQSQPANQQLRD